MTRRPIVRDDGGSGHPRDRVSDDARSRTLAERRAQGLPDKINDPATIARVAALLRAPWGHEPPANSTGRKEER